MIDLHHRPSHDEMSLWLLLEQDISPDPDDRDLPSFFDVLERREVLTIQTEVIR